MTLTERVVVDKIEVLEDGQTQIRTVTVIEKDGAEVARSLPHRHVIAPGDDVSKENVRVQAVANAVWTPEVVAAYQVKTTR